MKKIIIVIGTRPEAIKMYPLILELKKRKNMIPIICLTGQHRSMIDQFINKFNITVDYDLDIMDENQSLQGITIKVLQKIDYILKKELPDYIMVHGDTSSAFAAALAAFYQEIPIIHIEAGLRTYEKLPYPEEFNRISIDHMSSYHFAPTENAKINLINEGIAKASIFVTGNTIIDVLKKTIQCEFKHPILNWAENSILILLTVHRRENIGIPLISIFNALNKIIDTFHDVKIVYPIHLNPTIRNIAKKHFNQNDRLLIVEPLDVIEFHNILYQSDVIVTDSGGVQEEAISLNKNLLILRDYTERSEGIIHDNIHIVGNDEMKIFHILNRVLEKLKTSQDKTSLNLDKSPFGDGFASKRILDILCDNNLIL